jgi:hypothetical protein
MRPSRYGPGTKSSEDGHIACRVEDKHVAVDESDSEVNMVPVLLVGIPRVPVKEILILTGVKYAFLQKAIGLREDRECLTCTSDVEVIEDVEMFNYVSEDLTC